MLMMVETAPPSYEPFLCTRHYPQCFHVILFHGWATLGLERLKYSLKDTSSVWRSSDLKPHL